jgi:uncharacterized protein with von Willebrand factor type A (vWA) domain
MESRYAALVSAANDYIRIQRGRGGVVSVVLFDSSVEILFEQQTNDIPQNEIDAVRRGGTIFTLPLQMALEIFDRNNPQYECRIIFFTDGQAKYPSSEIAALESRHVRMDVVGLGQVDQPMLESLVTCGGTVTTGEPDELSGLFSSLAAMD